MPNIRLHIRYRVCRDCYRYWSNHKIPGVLKRLHGIGGHQDVVSQYVDFIQIENCRLENIQIEFGDIENTFGINGILGTNLLRFMKLYLDFNQHMIEFCL